MAPKNLPRLRLLIIVDQDNLLALPVHAIEARLDSTARQCDYRQRIIKVTEGLAMPSRNIWLAEETINLPRFS